MNIRKTIIEIIQKECELYRLKEFGLLTSVEEEADRLLSLHPEVGVEPFSDLERFKVWRKSVISFFYSLLGYTGFLKANKHKEVFSRFLLSLRKRQVKRMQEHWTEETIDSVLSVSTHTLAFKLSVMLSEEADRLLLPFIDSCPSPYELEERCHSFCRNYFPIDLEKLLLSLRKNDEEFWNDIYLLIKQIAVRVTSYSLLTIQYKEETEQDTWSESSLLFREKVMSEAIPVFAGAAHFYNYIVRICQNKCHEVMRRNRQSEVSMADPELEPDILSGGITDNSEIVMQNVDICWLSDIDVTCDYEVSTALTAVLWDKTEPWYTRLVQGIEDKVATLLQHYVEGMSYEQIVLLCTSGISKEEQKRMQARLRQDVVRVRKELKERFVRILMDL
ncbi:hypothetical protein [Parabacteroides sp.]